MPDDLGKHSPQDALDYLSKKFGVPPEVLREGQDFISKLMPTFKGQSPVLPPVINGALVALFEPTIHPGYPEGGEQRAALASDRLLALDLLHKFFEARGHERALGIIRHAWERREGIALYLRNFDLGGRLMDAAEDGVWGVLGRAADPIHTSFVGSIASTEDWRFQRALAEHIAPHTPVIGIENPVMDSASALDLPKLSFADDSWKDIVSQLIGAAKVIFLFYAGSARGIDFELELVRRAGRQSATVLALAVRSDDPFVPAHVVLKPDAAKVEDFPHLLRWDASAEAVASLVSLVDLMPPQQEALRFSSQPPLPAAPQPPTAVRDETDSAANMMYLHAMRWIKEGSLLRAEDALVGCIALSYWSGLVLARTAAYHALVLVQMHQRKPAPFRENLARWLDILEYVRSSSRFSVGLPVADLDAVCANLPGLIGEEGAHTLAARIAALKSSWPSSPAAAPSA
jgi:hypothetical protein